jgi:uncharacterized damage-inducible protein DinB
MPHYLVTQLRFTRSEWLRGLAGVSPEEAARHFEPMNSISWLVGHLAWHEQLYWLQRAQGQTLVPEVMACANGQPMSTPDLEAMLAAWQTITQAADPYLDALTDQELKTHLMIDGSKPAPENIGRNLVRMTFHYWYHLGEMQAIRQLLGHTDLPRFIGPMAALEFEA